jgi:hypothetical protein
MSQAAQVRLALLSALAIIYIWRWILIERARRAGAARDSPWSWSYARPS